MVVFSFVFFSFFFFNDTATTEIYTLSLHDAFRSPVSKAEAWLDIRMYEDAPLQKTLSGLGIEYRIIQLSSREAGKREAKISFNVGQGTQDIGFRNDSDLLFNCLRSRDVTF